MAKAQKRKPAKEAEPEIPVEAREIAEQGQVKEAVPGKIRNRNLGVKRVRAGDLIPHPKNWRTHPAQQAGALRGVLEEVGFVGVLLARETPAGLQLIDGHLRAETLSDEIVEVMVVDVDDHEVDVLLATHDPLGDIAEADSKAFDNLVRDLMVADGAISQLLSDTADGMAPPGRDPTARLAKEADAPQYPITPVFNERYDYAVIFTTNETDWGALQTILELQREKSYKTTGVATGRVVPFAKFYELWEKWMDGEKTK